MALGEPQQRMKMGLRGLAVLLVNLLDGANIRVI
jgi:hypothetical protein